MAYYIHDVEACLSPVIGPDGLEPDVFGAWVGRTASALETLRSWHAEDSLPLLRLPERNDDVAALEPVAERLRENFRDIIVLGTGGSSLGGKSLSALADPGAPLPDGGQPDSPRLHFMDNIDPVSFDRLFARTDPAATAFIVISKSGGTAETLTQFLYCLDVFRKALPAGTLGRHFLAVTEPRDNPLRRLAEEHGFETLDHDPNIGGRYSVLSVVGLLPAMIAGLDAEAVRRGAASVLTPILGHAGPEETPAAVGAALAVALSKERAISQLVLMPYVDRLHDFAFWYRQLWAESLGKNGEGTTPVNALGTVDQHSQLQLYLAGPGDKAYTVIFGPSSGTGGRVPEDLAGNGDLSYLAGRRMGDLLDAEQRATADTLIANQRPTRRITLPEVNEESIGALMMHFMLETIIAAQLLNVDAFDQPAVEQGKVLAREYLGQGAGQEEIQ